MARCVALYLLAFVVTAGASGAEKRPSASPDFGALLVEYPQHKDWIERARHTAKVYSGTVSVDGVPRAGVRVTDGVDFALSDDNGRYTLTVQPAEFQPYLPFRTISVCWPKGTWPRRGEGAGNVWWRRIADIADPTKVDFQLVTRDVPKSDRVAFIADVGDSLSGPVSTAIRAGFETPNSRPAFAVCGGFFAGRSIDTLKPEDCGGAARAAESFPVPFFALPAAGNADWESWRAPGELSGAGRFTKYFGPLHHSFDFGGVRVILFQSVNVGRTDMDWLRRDLASVPKDGVVYLFADRPVPELRAFWRDTRIRIVEGGQNTFRFREHRDDVPVRVCPLKNGYRLVRLGDGKSLLRCVEGPSSDPWKHAADCPLHQESFDNAPAFKAESAFVVNGTKDLPIKHSNVAFRMRVVGRATSPSVTKWGIRLTDMFDKVHEVSLSPTARAVSIFENAGSSAEAAGDGLLEFRLAIMPEYDIGILNGREAGFTARPIVSVQRIELFSEGGPVEFTTCEAWDAYDAAYAKYRRWIDMARRAPNTFSGTVYLDGKPCPNVKVTDGVDFVRTGEDGRYTITLAPNRYWPYAPSRTISVSWPENTWPIQDRGGGNWSWWARVMDIKDPKKVDFQLRTRRQKMPLCIGFMTDPHDSTHRPHNYVMRDEIAAAKPGSVDFAVLGGDMGYIGMANADAEYPLLRKFVNNFSVPMMALVGNHDVDYPRFREPHELSGDGAFTKYLGPAHWSFDVGPVHIVSMQYSNVGPEDADWLDRDLTLVPPGRPVYIFMHMWEPPVWGPISKHEAKIRLIQGGHSHQTLYCTPPGGPIEIWTYMSMYRLIYIEGRYFDFVDREIAGGRSTWDAHWNHLGQGALHNDWAATQPVPRGQTRKPIPTVGREDQTLRSETREVPLLPGRETFDLRVGVQVPEDLPARTWGVRITAADGAVHEVSYDEVNRQLFMLGRKTYFQRQLTPAQVNSNPRVTETQEDQNTLELRLLVMPDRVQVLANNRLGYFRFVKVGLPKKIEIFASDGTAAFKRYDMWQHDYPDFKPVYVRPNR